MAGASSLATTVATGGIGAGTALMVSNLTNATSYSNPVLYSGGEAALNAARNYQRLNGGTLMGDTVIGKAASKLASRFPQHYDAIWAKASQLFCQFSSGSANAFIANSEYSAQKSIFWQYEMSSLLNNTRIVEIIIEIFE